MRVVIGVLVLAALLQAGGAARGDHDYEEMFTTEPTTTTTTLSPVLKLYEEALRRQRERRGHGLGLGLALGRGLGLGRYYRRRHALGHARRLAEGRCADGESTAMLRFAASGASEALQAFLSGGGEPTLQQQARRAHFIFTGKVVGRGGRGPRHLDATTPASNLTRRGRQTHDLVSRGSLLWVRVKRVLKGDLGALLGSEQLGGRKLPHLPVHLAASQLQGVLVQLQTDPPRPADQASRAACPQLLRVHHTAIFLADKDPGLGDSKDIGEDEWNTVPDVERAPRLRLVGDPFALTLRNLQVASSAAKGNRASHPRQHSLALV